MAESFEKIDLSANNALSQLETFKQNSQRLQLESFKVDSALRMFNACADKCQLKFRENGLNFKGEVPEDAQCFQNCI